MVYTLRWHRSGTSQGNHYEILAGEEKVFEGYSDIVDELLKSVGVLFTEEYVNG